MEDQVRAEAAVVAEREVREVRARHRLLRATSATVVVEGEPSAMGATITIQTEATVAVAEAEIRYRTCSAMVRMESVLEVAEAADKKPVCVRRSMAATEETEVTVGAEAAGPIGSSLAMAGTAASEAEGEVRTPADRT
jgi:hypothetical protein